MENGRTGEQVTWNNPDSGSQGSTTIDHTYVNAAGQQCKRFTEVVTAGGQTETVKGSACKQPDGSWKVVAD